MTRVIIEHFKKTWTHHLRLQLSTLLVLTGSFAVITGLLLLGSNLNRVLTMWGENLQMSVYLNDSISEAEKTQLKTSLEAHSEIEKSQFFSKEDSLQSFREQMASYAPDLLSNDEILNVIPESYRLTMSKSILPQQQMDTMKNLAAGIMQIPGVNEVSYGQDWVKQYAHVISAAHILGYSLMAIILLSAFFIIMNVVQTSISQRRHEIEVLELIGATSKFIRMPYIWEGVVTSLFSVTAALLVSLAVFNSLKNLLQNQISFLQLSQHIQFLDTAEISAIVLVALFIGVTSAFLCVRKLNSGWLASQKKNLEFNADF